MLRGATVDTGPLRRNAQYRLLFSAQSVSQFGSAFSLVAFPFAVYALTRSSLAVGLLGLVEIVPLLTMAFVGGALADAFDRRRLVQATEAALALCSFGLALNAIAPHPAIWPIFVVAALAAALDALQRPALDSLVPRLVARDEVTAVAALGTLRSTLLGVAGPALAGWLIAWLGLGIAFAIDGATYAASFALLFWLRAVAPVAAAPPGIGRVLEGLRYAASRRDLLGTYLVDFVAMFFGMPNALFPALASAYGGATVVGLFYAAPSAGAALVAATSGWTNRVRRHGRAIVVAALIWGAAIVGLGLAHALPFALLALAVAGGADAVSGFFRATIWNQSIPDELRGRMAGLEFISYSSGPALGNVEAGAVANWLGPRISVLSGGILCVAGVALAALALPALWRYEVTGTSDRSARSAPS
jgi:MFS family permease